MSTAKATAAKKAATRRTPVMGTGEPEVNEVRLVGRISSAPEERVLPSGDTVWTFRVVVRRVPAVEGSRQTVDALDCVVRTGRARRTVGAWSVDDVVEVHGSVRRRFYRASGPTVSRVEIEVGRGRLIRRAASG